MERVNAICRHALWRESVDEIARLEQDRAFCRHDRTHFLDVARLAYIENLERGLGVDKELIYAAALLHDIGRHLQYTQNIPHDEAGAQLLYTLVPEQRTVFAEYYPDWMDNPGQQTKRSRQALFAALERAEIPALDLTPVFAQQSDLLSCYSRVDHHYTLKGAYVTYQSVCEAFGIRASEISIAETQSDLLGTYNRKLYDLSPVREAMQVVQTPFPEYERLDNGAASDTPLIRIRGSGQSLYGDYMGGDIAETCIRTDRPSLPTALIFGDSFTNAVESLAYYSFDEMRSVDLRHYKTQSISDYIAAYQPDVVICIRDYEALLSRSDNGGLS